MLCSLDPDCFESEVYHDPFFDSPRPPSLSYSLDLDELFGLGTPPSGDFLEETPNHPAIDPNEKELGLKKCLNFNSTYPSEPASSTPSDDSSFSPRPGEEGSDHDIPSMSPSDDSNEQDYDPEEVSSDDSTISTSDATSKTGSGQSSPGSSFSGFTHKFLHKVDSGGIRKHQEPHKSRTPKSERYLKPNLVPTQEERESFMRSLPSRHRPAISEIVNNEELRQLDTHEDVIRFLCFSDAVKTSYNAKLVEDGIIFLPSGFGPKRKTHLNRELKGFGFLEKRTSRIGTTDGFAYFRYFGNDIFLHGLL